MADEDDVIFRVIRIKNARGQTEKLLLEPMRGKDRVKLQQGSEFVTGRLNSDPWKDDPNNPSIDANWRKTK